MPDNDRVVTTTERSEAQILADITAQSLYLRRAWGSGRGMATHVEQRLERLWEELRAARARDYHGPKQIRIVQRLAGLLDGFRLNAHRGAQRKKKPELPRGLFLEGQRRTNGATRNA